MICIENLMKCKKAIPQVVYNNSGILIKLDYPKSNSMRSIFYLLIYISTIIISCRRDNAAADTQKVRDRLNGKYKAVSAVSDEPMDVNVDGTASMDILEEMEDLKECELDIRIVEKDKFLFSQLWPEQYVSPNPPPVINYACQGVGRWFSIAADNTTLLLKPDDLPPIDPYHKTFPQSVRITGTDSIEVILNKTLYTANGTQTVNITTLYVRYTKIT